MIALSADDAALLLVLWLRELLYLHQVESLAYRGVDFDALSERRVSARVRLGSAGQAIREIEGVTYHEVEVAREGAGWRARVVFDV